jgi:hypothetical protein
VPVVVPRRAPVPRVAPDAMTRLLAAQDGPSLVPVDDLICREADASICCVVVLT